MQAMGEYGPHQRPQEGLMSSGGGSIPMGPRSVTLHRLRWGNAPKPRSLGEADNTGQGHSHNGAFLAQPHVAVTTDRGLLPAPQRCIPGVPDPAEHPMVMVQALCPK